MGCVVASANEAVKVAVQLFAPLLQFALVIVKVPRVVPLSWKVTVPVGVPAPGEEAATVAVKVTA